MSGNGFDLVDFFNLAFNDFPLFLKTDVRGSYGTPSFPPANVSINKENKDLVFDFALAGYTDDELDISFSGDYLLLKIESNKKENEQLKPVHIGIKRQDVNFKYYVPSDKYDQDGVVANLANGILTIKVPAREEAQKKKIVITK